MTSPSSRPPPALEQRVAALERALVQLVGGASLLCLAIGSFLPWIEDSPDHDDVIFQFGLYVFSGMSVIDDGGENAVILLVSFLIFDLTTLAAVISLGFAMGGGWERKLIGSVIVIFLVCCIVGAGTVSFMAAGVGMNDSEATVHWGTYLTWVTGAIGTIWVLNTPLARPVATEP